MKDDYAEFVSRLHSHHYRGSRYLSGLVLLSSYLNPKQNKADFYELLVNGKFDIEHILPRAWNHYDGWTEEKYNEQIDSLGNLIPLQKTLNIKASNEFFDKKKVHYRESKVQDALDLCKLPKWTPEQLDQKFEENIRRLVDWFGTIVGNESI